MKKASLLILTLALILSLSACGPRQATDLPFTLSYGEQSLSGIYNGTVVDKAPSGQGTFVYTNGDDSFSYTGGWLNGQLSGLGQLETNLYTIVFSDGITRTGLFKGNVVDGVAKGSGSFTAENDDGVTYTYTGAWDNGIYNGHGVTKYDADDYFIKKGNYTDGDFTPTPAQFFVAQGSLTDAEYELTENALSYIEAYPEVFTSHNYEGAEFEKSFKYTAFAKNPSNYGSKLISVSRLSVVQIREENYWGNNYTFLIAQDAAYNVYYVNLYGQADGIFEGSVITLIALPLAYFTYPNTAGTSIYAIACAGVSVT